MYHLSVYLHLLAAMVWVGGLLFLALVVVPVARFLPDQERAALFQALGRRFRVIGWAALGLLIATGIINAAYRDVTWESVVSGELLAGRFGLILALKVGLVAAMAAVVAVHDFVLGPASARALAEGWKDVSRVEMLRRRASWLARISAVLALLAVALAVALVRGLPG